LRGFLHRVFGGRTRFFPIDLHQPGFDAPRMFFSIDLDERNGRRGARR
jgi:hypothetical protein